MSEQYEQNQEHEGKKDEEENKDEEPLEDNQIVDTQLPLVTDINEDKKEEKNEETEKEKEEGKTDNKEGREENKVEKTKPIKTPLSLDSKKKVVDEEDDDDDDALSIQGPLDMDKLSSIELMEIATSMQSRDKKKRMKEQQNEVETIRNDVDILSSLLLETDTGNFATPIDKLGQLVSDAGEKMKSLEDAAYVNVEKNYKKKRIEHLMSEIYKGKVTLTINKDCLKEALENECKILSTVSTFSLFCVDLKKKREEVDH